MVAEAVVLLRVEDFEQCACRIPVVRRGHLVDFVEDKDRVLCASFLDALDNPPGQGPDVCPPVPADLGFVPDAAKADPDILPAQRLRDALSEARLTGARRS